MIQKSINRKIISGLLAISLLATSFGGALALPAAAAPASPAAEEAAQDGGSKTGLLAAIAAVGLIAVLSGGGGGSDSPPSKGTGSTGAGSSGQTGTISTADEQQALSLLNRDRAAHGLPALKANSQLTALARNYAQDMIRRGFFSHNNPEGQSPFDRMRQAGISYKYAGENLAVNSSVAGAEAAFMNSPGHRANILNANYTEVGIGVVRSSSGSLYVVQEFIGR